MLFLLTYIRNLVYDHSGHAGFEYDTFQQLAI